MAELKIDGRMKVKTLKANFKSNFGSTLRVYKSVTCKGAFADDDATLASLRAEGAKGGELTVGGNKTVGKFEEEFAATWGLSSVLMESHVSIKKDTPKRQLSLKKATWSNKFFLESTVILAPTFRDMLSTQLPTTFLATPGNIGTMGQMTNYASQKKG